MLVFGLLPHTDTDPSHIKTGGTRQMLDLMQPNRQNDGPDALKKTLKSGTPSKGTGGMKADKLGPLTGRKD